MFEMNFHRSTRKLLSGRQSRKRQGELSLAITLTAIVFMHIFCNILRIFLGILVVVLVGKSKAIATQSSQKMQLNLVKTVHFASISKTSCEVCALFRITVLLQTPVTLERTLSIVFLIKIISILKNIEYRKILMNSFGSL